MRQLLPQDVNVTYLPTSWKLSQHWQMHLNQSLPSVQTGTEDRTVLYWTEVESGSAKAVEGIDPSVNTLHYAQPNLCWLLFVSVSSSLREIAIWPWLSSWYGQLGFMLQLHTLGRFSLNKRTVKVIKTHSVTAHVSVSSVSVSVVKPIKLHFWTSHFFSFYWNLSSSSPSGELPKVKRKKV